MNIPQNSLNALVAYAEARYRCLYRRNGFNAQAPNKYALRNRAIRYALTAGEDIIRAIGSANGLCRVKPDIVTCKSRAIHYGVRIGDTVGTKVFPIAWFKPEYEAKILRAVKANFKL